MEITDLSIIEYKALGCVVEGVFVVQDVLFQVVNAILIGLFGNGGVGFVIRDGLE